MRARANSVIKLSAQIAKALQPGPSQNSKISGVLKKLESNKGMLHGYYYLFILQIRTGCRISEALNVQIGHITADGNVLIKGLKGSKDRICYCPEILEWLPKARGNSGIVFFGMNRFSAYRYLKNLGISTLKNGRKHESVTHLFRELYIAQNLKIVERGSTLSESIGHKSQKSTEYYGKD